MIPRNRPCLQTERSHPDALPKGPEVFVWHIHAGSQQCGGGPDLGDSFGTMGRPLHPIDRNWHAVDRQPPEGRWLRCACLRSGHRHSDFSWRLWGPRKGCLGGSHRSMGPNFAQGVLTQQQIVFFRWAGPWNPLRRHRRRQILWSGKGCYGARGKGSWR